MFRTLTLALVAASIASSSMAFTANSLPGDIISGAEEVVFMKETRNSHARGTDAFAAADAAYQAEKGYFKLAYFGLTNTRLPMIDASGNHWSMKAIADASVADIVELQAHYQLLH